MKHLFINICLTIAFCSVLIAEDTSSAPADPNSPAIDISINETIASPNDFFATLLNPVFVTNDGMVDYAKIRRQKSTILDIIDKINKIKMQDFITWPEEEQKAFWINTYNICVIKTVYDNYPIEPSRIKMIFYPAQSIMQINDPFTDKYFAIMGKEYNLNEIEKSIVGLQGDANILLALSQAALSSPRLQQKPYTGQTLMPMLNEQLLKTLMREDFIKIDSNAKTIVISRFFRDKAAYFDQYYATKTQFAERKESERALVNFIASQKKDANWVIYRNPDFKVKFGYFDWRLNDKVID